MDFKLPDIGEGLTQGEVTKWLVREGDAAKVIPEVAAELRRPSRTSGTAG